MPPETPSSPPARRGSCLMVIVGLSLLSIVGPALLLLPTGPIGPVIFFGGLGCGVVFAFHYLVWGRQLSRLLREAEEDGKGGTPDRP